MGAAACSCGVVHAHDDHELAAAQGLPWRHAPDDPTATKSIRNAWGGDMWRRFRALKGAVRTGLVENDALGIADMSPEERAGPVGLREPRAAQDRTGGAGPGINIRPPSPGEFAFPSDPAKVEAFNEWLREQERRGLLEVRPAPGTRPVSSNRAWQNVYIRRAYSQGVTHADDALVSQGIIATGEVLEDIFRNPAHADAVGLLFTRSYNELDGVTSAMSQTMSRELATGLSQGHHPRRIARTLNRSVDDIGLRRGRLIARTETIRAHNEGALNRYASVERRLDGVTLIAEWLTAGDRRVCDLCASQEGTLLTIREARGRIPLHPNCRCTWVPVQREGRSNVEGLVGQVKRAYVRGEFDEDGLDRRLDLALDGHLAVALT